jgi:P4 family phage/plasmid primase-like protien
MEHPPAANVPPASPPSQAYPILSTALSYHAAGRSTVPTARGRKAPSIYHPTTGEVIEIAWKPYQDTPAAEDELREWFAVDHLMGLGIVAGPVSGAMLEDGTQTALEIMDFDELAIFELFRELLTARGYGHLFEQLPWEKTPKPGAHLGYLCCEWAGNTKLAQRKIGTKPDGSDEIVTLIETRGQGGQCVVAPTPPGIHPDHPERGYVMVQGSWAATPVITPKAREVLWECARALNEYVPHDASHRETRGQTTHDEQSPGAQYHAQVSRDELIALLTQHGWSVVFSRNGTDYLCRPGKAGRAWSATLGYVAPKMLYVFTTNGHPFDADRAYDPFGVYTRLKHGGDFTAAARALAEAGYSRQTERNGSTPPPQTEPLLIDDTSENFHLTDWGNARRFIHQHGRDLHYIDAWAMWLRYVGQQWELDRIRATEAQAKQVIAMVFRRASRLIAQMETRIASGDENTRDELEKQLTQLIAVLKWSLKSESAPRIKAMVELAKSEPNIAIPPERLDADPWLLNCLNGTLDLRTGTLRPHCREDLLTKMCPVAYDSHAQCPLWLKFLREIMAGNKALISYLQRAIGYSLSGNVTEQCLFFLFGAGQNGKSTFLSIILALLADYAMQTIPELLMIRSHEQHPTERADLFGKRLVATIEVESGKRLAESLVKQLTGGDRIRARYMRQDFFEFSPTHKIWLAANHLPVIAGTDHAIWRRIRLIPFTVRIPDEQIDKSLSMKLQTELPGILTWAVRGCMEWQQQKGLTEPKEVSDATNAYREEMNQIGQFLEECCWLKPNDQHVKTRSSWLHDAYVRWSGESITQKVFTARLSEMGYGRKRSTSDGHIYWLGIGLIVGAECYERSEREK